MNVTDAIASTNNTAVNVNNVNRQIEDEDDEDRINANSINVSDTMNVYASIARSISSPTAADGNNDGDGDGNADGDNDSMHAIDSNNRENYVNINGSAEPADNGLSQSRQQMASSTTTSNTSTQNHAPAASAPEPEPASPSPSPSVVHLILPLHLFSRIYTTILTTITILRSILLLFFQFFFFTFQHSVPTKELHAISIALLTIHFMTRAFLDTILPAICLKMLTIVRASVYSEGFPFYGSGNDHDFEFNFDESGSSISDFIGSVYLNDKHGNGHGNRHGITGMDGSGTGTRFTGHETLDRIFYEILMLGIRFKEMAPASQSSTSQPSASASVPNNMEATIQLFDSTPLASLILPSTILSLFLILTMVIFLIFHVAFQGLFYVTTHYSNYINNNNNNNNGNNDNNNGNRDDNGNGNHNNTDNNSLSVTLSNSPLAMAAIVLFLVLENALPWLFFASGVYLSLSVGGMLWCVLMVGSCILLALFKILRTVVFTQLQDGEEDLDLEQDVLIDGDEHENEEEDEDENDDIGDDE